MVRIGTWNLENLAPPGPDSASPESQAAYDAKLMALIEIPQCCSARFLTLGSCQG